MNSFAFSVFIGAALGFLSGLGTGGGSLLILWLTLVIGLGPEEARIINLLFFIPSALFACIFRIKQGQLQIKKVLPAIIAGSLCSAVISYIADLWDPQILRKAFGILLLITGFKELLFRQKSKPK